MEEITCTDNLLKLFRSNFLSSGMHGFRDNEVLLPTGYDVIVSPSLGALHAHFHDWLWKSDNEFLIALHSNFLSEMPGFRDNEVLLQAGYDVIVISPPGGAASNFLIANSERATPI